MESDGRLVTKTPTRGPWLLGRVFLGFPVCALLAYGIRLADRTSLGRMRRRRAALCRRVGVLGSARYRLGRLAGVGAGAFLTRSRPWPFFLTVSLCFVGLVGLAAFAMNVPAHDPSFYAEYGEGDLVQWDCYPDGRPKWWPLWLPG